MSTSIPPAGMRAPGVPGGSYVIEEVEELNLTNGPNKPQPQDPYWVDGIEPGDHGAPSIFGPGGGQTAPSNPVPESPATTEVDRPPAPDRKDPPPIKTGLGDKIDEILNRSPTLRQQWAAAKDKGWVIKIDEHGGSSRAEPKTKTIFIDRQELTKSSESLASLLAHEIGHAATPFPNPVEARTEQEFVSKTVKQRMEHEGAAAFENARARDEIMYIDGFIEDGPNIGIRGGFDDEYIAIYERYKRGEISEERAKALMTEWMSREPAGVNPDGSYFTKEDEAIREARKDWETQQLNTGPASAQ